MRSPLAVLRAWLLKKIRERDIEHTRIQMERLFGKFPPTPPPRPKPDEAPHA